jgi:hypothetical protein
MKQLDRLAPICTTMLPLFGHVNRQGRTHQMANVFKGGFMDRSFGEMTDAQWEVCMGLSR